jgi:hypothetical protein
MEGERRIVLHSVTNQWLTGIFSLVVGMQVLMAVHLAVRGASEGAFVKVVVGAAAVAVALSVLRFMFLRARSVVATPEGLEIGGWKKLESLPWSTVSAIENRGIRGTIWGTRVYRVEFRTDRAGFFFIGRVGIAADLERLRAGGACPVAVSPYRLPRYLSVVGRIGNFWRGRRASSPASR